MALHRAYIPASKIPGHVTGMRTIDCRYKVTEGKELSDVDLEAGDFLPEDASYLITASRFLENKDRMAQIATVHAVRPVTYTGANPFGGGLVELVRTRGRVREGENTWNGVRRLICPNALAAASAENLWDQAWPSAMGDARCRKTAETREFLPGHSEIAAYYKTLRTPGKARLLTRMEAMSAQSKRLDLDGKIIEGVDYDGLHEYHIVQGKEFATTAVPFEIVVLQTAFYANQFRLQAGHDLYRSVNNADLPNFGNAKKGTMLFVGQKIDWEWGDDLVNVDYLFQWSGNEKTWNETVKSQKGVWIASLEKVYTRPSDGGAFTKTTAQGLVWKFVPGGEIGDAGVLTWTETETRKLFPEKSFSALNALVSW